VPGKGRCLECLKRNAKHSEKYIKERGDKGFCINCNNKAVLGKLRCFDCLLKFNEISKKYYDEHPELCIKSKDRRNRYKLERRCTACGAPLMEEEKGVRCVNCNEINRGPVIRGVLKYASIDQEITQFPQYI
jgi:hypothetical protein